MEIKLTFINQSSDQNNVDVVFFQKNRASFNGEAVAWKVLKNNENGWGTQFNFSTDFLVSVQDSDGAPTPQLAATLGDKFVVEMNDSKFSLMSAGKGSNPEQITIQNDTPNQTINALLYNEEQLIACQDGGAPGQTATFELNSFLWMGVCSNIDQGQIMSAAVVQDFNGKVLLDGVASADIVLYGGGSGPDKTPYRFDLENVVRP